MALTITHWARQEEEEVTLYFCNNTKRDSGIDILLLLPRYGKVVEGTKIKNKK